MSRLIDKLEMLLTELKLVAHNSTISDDELRAAIAKSLGFDPRTINGYIRYLTYFNYITTKGTNEWQLVK